MLSTRLCGRALMSGLLTKATLGLLGVATGNLEIPHTH